MTWAEIKTVCQILYPQYVGAGNIISDSDGDTTTPSSLAVLFDLVHNRIWAYPHEFSFLKETSTVALTGATTIDLATELPGLKSVYQLFGINTNQEQTYFPNYQGNITDAEGYTIKDKSLILTGTSPVGGSLQIQWKSKFMVKSAAGTRKQYFLEDDDYSVIDDVNVLIFGIGQYINWQADSASKERKDEIMGWYKESLANLVLDNEQTSQVHSRL